MTQLCYIICGGGKIQMNICKGIGAILIGICVLGGLSAEEEAAQIFFAVIFGGSGALLFFSSVR